MSTHEVLLTDDCALNDFFLFFERRLLDKYRRTLTLTKLVLLVAEVADADLDEAEERGSVAGCASLLAGHAKTFDTS